MDNSLQQDNGQQFALEGRGDVSCLFSLHPSVPGTLQMGWPSSFILSWSQASRRRPFRYFLEGNCFKMSCWFLPSVQSLSRVRLFVTPRTAAHQTFLSITNSSRWCCPLLSSSVFPSIRVFSNESVLHIRWPKHWSFSFSISPSSEYSGLISLRTDWFNLLKIQGTLKSLFQHNKSKASVLWCSAFFIVQLSHPYMTTGKTIALTRWIFVGKVMSLLFNMLSRLLIAFLPRSKHLLISWLQSPSAVILEPKKIVCHCFHCFPICLPWSDGTGCHNLSFLNVEL